MHGYAVMIYQVCDLDKKQRLFEAVIFLERITGDKTKTVDNCFCCSKSTKQGAEGVSVSNDAQQLCDLTGLEPDDPNGHWRGRSPYPLKEKLKSPLEQNKKGCTYTTLIFWSGYKDFPKLNPARMRFAHLGGSALGKPRAAA